MKPLNYLLILLFTLGVAACDQVVAPDTEATEPLSHLVAEAPPHSMASGTFTQTGITSIEFGSAGPNTIIEQTSVGTVAGTLSGTYEDDLRVVIHPNGNFNAKFTIRCECTVGGQQGVIDFVATDRGQLVSETLAEFTGRAVITGASGDLAGLRGVLGIEGTIDLATGLSTYDYSGRIH